MLHCWADGCSPTAISWHFHGDNVTGVLPNGTLVIPKFQMTDVGMYTCVAQNDGGRSETEAVLYPYFGVPHMIFQCTLIELMCVFPIDV